MTETRARSSWAPDWLPYALALPMGVVVTNTTLAAIIQPAIASTYGLSADEVGWVVFGYTASFAVSTVVYAAVAARVGVGRALAFGVVLFSLTAVLMTLSTSFEQLMLLRVVQGVGAGAIPTLTTTLAAASWSDAGRIRAMGILVTGVGIGQAAGPITAGLMLELATWQSALLVGAIGAPIAVLAYRADPEPGDRAIQVDGVGMTLLGIFAGGTVLFLNRLPVSGLDGAVVIAGVVALAGLGAFGLHVRRADDSILPRSLRQDRRYLGTLFIAGCSFVAFLGMIVVIPLATVAAGGATGLALGLAYLPMALGVAVCSMTTARSQARFGRWGVVRLGLLLQAAGVFALALVGPAADLWFLALLMGLNGVGMGLNNAPQLNDVSERFGLSLRPRALGIWHLCFFLPGGAAAALATGMIGAGWELPFIGDAEVPGYSTVLLLMGIVVSLPVLLHGPYWSDRRSAAPIPVDSR